MDRWLLGALLLSALVSCEEPARPPSETPAPRRAPPVQSAEPPHVDTELQAPAQKQPSCVLGTPGDPEAPVPIFATETALNDFMTVLSSGDGEQISDARRALGALLVLPGTRCTILDGDVFGSARKVIVRDGPHSGRIAWASSRWSSYKNAPCVLGDGSSIKEALFTSAEDAISFRALLNIGNRNHIKEKLAAAIAIDPGTRCNLIAMQDDPLQSVAHVLVLEGKHHGLDGWAFAERSRPRAQ